MRRCPAAFPASTMFSSMLRVGRRVVAPVARTFTQRAQAEATPAAAAAPMWGKLAAVAGTLGTLAYVSNGPLAVAADDTVSPANQQIAKIKQLHSERRARIQQLIASVANDQNLVLFAGRANVALAQEVAEYLSTKLGNITVGRFADGEVKVQVNQNVRGKDIYIFQPTCPPVNENLMELLLMVSTMRRASAKRITVIIPYYGYARQDRKMTARVPISAADVARLLEAMGVDRVVAVDLHCGQIQGFFGPRVPVDNLDGGYVGVEYFGQKGTFCFAVALLAYTKQQQIDKTVDKGGRKKKKTRKKRAWRVSSFFFACA